MANRSSVYCDCTWGIPEAVTHMKSGILVGESDPEGINRWLERPAWCDALRESLGVDPVSPARSDIKRGKTAEYADPAALRCIQD